MDPLITNGIDPALLRVLEKRGHDRDATARRKRPAHPGTPREEENVAAEPENNLEDNDDPDTLKHTLDDLA
ncbi:MAG: hypothetical protein ABSB87_02865 [Terriglobales bacterium]|jgi:uncharacterized protein YbjT (DUF2867 family)